MTPLARGYSFVMYLAEAGATYSIPFPFLHTDDVRVFAGDVGDAVEQSVVWTSPTTLQLSGEVPQGILITLRRFTPRDDNLVVIQEGAQLPAGDLNLNSRQLLYIIQEQIDFGTYGGSGLPGGGVGWPNQPDGGNEAIQQIIDQLMQSPIMALLVSRIDQIDDTAETILEELLRSEQQFDYRRESAARIALVETTVTTIQDENQSFAEQIVDVYAKFDATEAQIRVVDQARATDTAASAVRFEGVNARIGQSEANITDTRQALATLTDSTASRFTHVDATFKDSAARITTVEQSVATETSARATAITQLAATVTAGNNAVNARITVVNQAVADEVSARTLAINKTASDFKAADGEVSRALTQTLTTTYATKDYAQSTAQTQVEAFANNKFAILQERFEALVDGTADPGSTGEWQANWTVRINAGAINGVPVIAGIGLGVDSKTGSNFVVMADRFGIVTPTYTTSGGVQQMKYPFVVGTVGGVSTVGITGQLIVDGSVTADKIRANSLSAISANLGEVNGGTFRTFQLDANGAIINPQEFRAEMTNNPGDAYPMWIGGGVKNYNNAVFCVDRSGNAKFAGKITAGNMIGTLQANANQVWTGDITAAANGVGPIITLPAPALLGEVHLPLIHVETKINNPSGSGATGGIYLERLSGSTWVTVKVHNHYINGGATDFDSLLAFDAPASGAVQYRVRIGPDPYTQNNAGNFHGTAITIYAIGMR